MSKAENELVERSVRLAVAKLSEIPPTEQLKFGRHEIGGFILPSNPAAEKVFDAMGGLSSHSNASLGKTFRAFIDAIRKNGYTTESVYDDRLAKAPVTEVTILNPEARAMAGIRPAAPAPAPQMGG